MNQYIKRQIILTLTKKLCVTGGNSFIGKKLIEEMKIVPLR